HDRGRPASAFGGAIWYRDRTLARPGAHGAGAGHYDAGDADDGERVGNLPEQEQSDDGADGWFEAHQRAERGGRQAPQAVQLENERNDRHEQGQANPDRDQRGTELRGAGRPGGDGGYQRGDRQRDAEPGDSADVVTDPPREQDVPGVAGGRPEREGDPGTVDGATPRLGEQQHPASRDHRPQRGPVAVAADGHRERPEELQGAGRPERQAGRGAHEQDAHPGGREPQDDACPQRGTRVAEAPGPRDGQHDHSGAEQPQ